MNKYLTGASVIAVSAVFCSAAYAQVDRIVVTATKRAEDAQDIPVAVQALGSENLDELRVDNFSDYLVQLPGVTAGGSGPGQKTIYIRVVWREFAGWHGSSDYEQADHRRIRSFSIDRCGNDKRRRNQQQIRGYAEYSRRGQLRGSHCRLHR